MNEGMERWRGRVALVTGASSGIGRSVAQALAEDGMIVFALARREDRLRDLQASLSNAAGELLPLRVDLRDTAAIEEAFGTIRAARGGVDVLVNNAGMGRNAPLTEGATEDWRAMLEINVLALCVCTREAVRDMRSRRDVGHVIHIGSMAGHRVPGPSGVYSASKFAVRSLTEGLRQELRDADSGVRVTAISPGFVETEFAERYHGDEEAARRTYGRFPCLTSDDVARSVRFVLASPSHVQFHDLLVRPTQQRS